MYIFCSLQENSVGKRITDNVIRREFKAMERPSILNPFRSAEVSTDQVLQLDLSQLRANPFQPRKQFDPMELEELSRSIREFGVIQPILVRKVQDGYEIIAGERRCRASRLAGLTKVPAVLRQLGDKEMAQIALIENLQRSDLNYFEEAEGYQRLMDEFGFTQEEVATRLVRANPQSQINCGSLRLHRR